MINPTRLIKEIPNGFNYKIPYINRHEKIVWLTHHERGWLGSGVKDIKGREIFEGDKVTFGELGNTGTVAFRNAMFVIDHDGAEKFTVLGNTVGFVEVEVVGHIAGDES